MCHRLGAHGPEAWIIGSIAGVARGTQGQPLDCIKNAAPPEARRHQHEYCREEHLAAQKDAAPCYNPLTMPAPASPPKPRRRWHQVSLRTLLLVMAAVVVGCGTLSAFTPHWSDAVYMASWVVFCACWIVPAASWGYDADGIGGAVVGGLVGTLAFVLTTAVSFYLALRTMPHYW